MDLFLNDLRHAARSLARTPGFTLGAALVLALGIGANAAIFSLVDAVLFRPLPVERPEELVRVYAKEATSFAGSDGISNSSYPVFEDYRDQATSFAALGAYADALPVHLVQDGGRPERLTAGVVTGRYFELLGARAQAGRLLTPADDAAPGREPVVVLSDRLWRRLFGADPRAVGATVRVNGHAFTVAGVAPAGFYGVSLAALPQLWVTTSMAPVALPEFGGAAMLADRTFSWLDMVGRLKPGVSMAQAQAELDTIAARRAAAQSGRDKDPYAKLLAAEARLEPGDLLVAFTDGIVEARRDEEEFGEERLVEVLVRVAAHPAEEIATGLLSAVASFADDEQRDDRAVLVARVKEAEA